MKDVVMVEVKLEKKRWCVTVLDELVDANEIKITISKRIRVRSRRSDESVVR
jgi:hypothetical protein